MADTETNANPTRPVWLPDTKGFLAIAIVVIMATIILTLLWKSELKLDEKVYGALLTLLGVLTGCFKDVYGWAFGSSQRDDKRDDAIVTAALAPPPPVPPAPVVVASWWSLLRSDEQAAIETAAAAVPPDVRVQAILAAFKSGKAEPADLADLVTKGLLTQARADEIKPK